jgi:hypothetical protein
MVSNLQQELRKQSNSGKNNTTIYSNQKELELLKEKIDNIEKDSNFLISINNEELKKHKENFVCFIISSNKFLQNLQNLFIALKKLCFPMQEFLETQDAFNSVNTDLILKDKILEKIENVFSKFEFLITQNNPNIADIKINNTSNFNYSVDKFLSPNNINTNNTINSTNKINNNNYNNNSSPSDGYEVSENTKISLLASKEKNKEFTEMLNKLEVKNKLLEEQVEMLKYNYNSELKQKFAAEENRISLSSNYCINPICNPNAACGNEIMEKLKSDLQAFKEKQQEAEATLDYIKKLNKDLETKNTLLEDELVKTKKNIKAANEKLIDYEILKQKNDGLEKEVEYKKSIIVYLENILKVDKSKKIFFDKYN